MSSDGNTENLTELRRGFQVWDYNPSASKVRLNSKETTIKIEHGSKVLLINGDTSEVLGEGTAAFLKKHIVDDEQFMKVYVGQLDIMFNLSKTGQQIFQIVWDIIQKSKDKDQVMLKPVMAKLLDKKISERTFQRGVRELLEKEFIYMGPIDGLYYINMSIFFNGNRIIAATEYIRGSALNRLDSKVIEIGNEGE